jgi:hypothetical protein
MSPVWPKMIAAPIGQMPWMSVTVVPDAWTASVMRSLVAMSWSSNRRTSPSVRALSACVRLELLEPRPQRLVEERLHGGHIGGDRVSTERLSRRT